MQLITVEEEDASLCESQHDSTTDLFQDESDETRPKTTIGAEENKRVIYSRVLVGIVLLACAALTTALAYTWTSQEENKRFESEVSVN